MPLIQSKSKKAFQKNVETEMKAHPGPENRAKNLAIAYSIKRKNAHKKASGGMVKSGSKDMDMAYGGMMAQGGEVEEDSARTESRPMPDKRYNDSKEVSLNRGNKPPAIGDDAKTQSDISYQARKGLRTTPIKHPKMVASNVVQARLRDEEDDLMFSQSPGPYGEKPPREDDEEGPNRQGPKVPDMEDEHSTHRKPYAEGGEVDNHLSDYRTKHMHLSKEEHAAKGKELRQASSDSSMSDKYRKNMSNLAEFHEKESGYAKGGMIDEMRHPSKHDMEPKDHDIQERLRMDEADLMDMEDPSEDEGRRDAMSRNEEGMHRQGPDVPDMEDEHSTGEEPYSEHGYAHGGSIQYNDACDNEDEEMELNPAHDHFSESGGMKQPEEEDDIMDDASLAAAIMAKRKAQDRLDSGSEAMDRAVEDEKAHYPEEDHMYDQYALGGEILHDSDEPNSHGSYDSDDSDQADLSRNADEDANEEDQMSFDALRKENYSESEGLRRMGSPEDSNLKGDEEESDSEDDHDMDVVSMIRRNMRRRSPISR